MNKLTTEEINALTFDQYVEAFEALLKHPKTAEWMKPSYQVVMGQTVYSLKKKQLRADFDSSNK